MMRPFNYLETLNTPGWKSKRLEIIERDKCCQRCGTKKNLEVHHLFYIYGVDAANYPNFTLITLCRKCHQKETEDGIVLNNLINYIKINSLFSDEIMKLYFSRLLESDMSEFNKFNKSVIDAKIRCNPNNLK